MSDYFLPFHIGPILESTTVEYPSFNWEEVNNKLIKFENKINKQEVELVLLYKEIELLNNIIELFKNQIESLKLSIQNISSHSVYPEGNRPTFTC